MKKLAFLLAVLSASPAFAQTSAPVSLAVSHWSGWYVGANLGYGFGSNNIHLEPASDGAVLRSSFVSPRVNVDPGGLLGGIQFGKNWQHGNFIYGFEADLSYAGFRDRAVSPLELPGPFFFQTTHVQKLDSFGMLRARAGIPVSERMLLLFSGGLAFGQAELSTFAQRTGGVFPCVSPTFCVSGQTQKWMVGWTVGTGLEFALASKWSAKFEYLYYDLGKITNTVVDVDPLVPPDVFRGSARINGNIIRLGLNYKFNP